jgi:hypothetical protein
MGEVQRYRQRLSGPLLDRIDLTLEVARLPVDKLARDEHGLAGEASSMVKARVMAARVRQYARNVALESRAGSYGGTGGQASLPAGGAGSLPADEVAQAAVPADSRSGEALLHPRADNQTELTDFTGDAGPALAEPGGRVSWPAPGSGGVCAAGNEVAQAAVPADISGRQGRLPHQEMHGCTNAALTSRQVKAYCALSEPCQALLMRAAERLGLSARAYERIRKVARTIADLAGSESIEVPHLAEAIQYRSGEERLRG